MSEQMNNEILSDCRSRLNNIMERLVDFSQDKGNETFDDIKFEFESLQCEFEDFSFGLDPQGKDMRQLTGRMEKTGELFKKIDEMLPL
ncbi:hypothetical protein [Candidatus Methylomicrobium oryzae]|uniref:hypothetical protein n=1 Tax=Candidatus Methylomicrobium oryzae TaxID=2802053 RepID=UPI0019219682|nr:hypothetical protein [Methylomicrobium sp. RS1]MBL1263888.1 hypothetical protein [Methylomicrobium sp. RS1]